MSHPNTIAALAAGEGGEVTPWDHVRRVVKMMTIARYWAGASNKATPVATEQWWVDLARLSAVYPPSTAADLLAESPSKRAVKSAKVLLTQAPSQKPSPNPNPNPNPSPNPNPNPNPSPSPNPSPNPSPSPNPIALALALP